MYELNFVCRHGAKMKSSERIVDRMTYQAGAITSTDYTWQFNPTEHTELYGTKHIHHTLDVLQQSLQQWQVALKQAQQYQSLRQLYQMF